ncbi:MAG TPA: aldehyde dehydrogenase [Rubrobacteraceae bacterium]|jgi:aldehyde dehydrogenase (NAD+)|nr:aldehyde dehydrogenase [Rubrobacteraceae bacterium]
MSVIQRPAVDEVREYKMLMGGRWAQAASGKTFESINPYTGQVWAIVAEADQEDVDAAVRAARKAFDEGAWGRMTGTERARLMRRLAELIAENADDLAIIESTDNGKLFKEMRGQLGTLPEWYYYFAGAADKIQGETIPSDKPNFFVYTRKEPVGVVGAIVPWNSPLLLLTFKLAPALAAGCTFVVKSAEQTPASVLEFGKLFEEAGFPPGVFNVVSGFGVPTGKALVSHPGVDKVAFTGSTQTGISVMKDAADHLAKVTLELGGKSPNIVFDDVDLEAANNGVISGIFAATGQTCIAGSRLFVQDRAHDELVERLSERATTIKLGDPLDTETEMGPVAFKEQLEKIEGYVQAGKEEGATLVCGGKRPDSDGLKHGYFIEPTIFAQVENGMKIAREEIFGPVLSVIPFKDEEELIRQTNDTDYGLAAGIWTKDIQRAHRVAHAIRAGTVWINAYRTLSFNTPFGGYKMSGLGRENGLEAVNEYTETKSVWVELSGQSRDPFTMG